MANLIWISVLVFVLCISHTVGKNIECSKDLTKSASIDPTKKVCVGYYGRTTTGLVLIKSEGVTGTDCAPVTPVSQRKCAKGWHVACCKPTTAGCLDSLTPTDPCESTTDVACSATENKVMKEGTSVCFRTFKNTLSTTPEITEVEEAESCNTFKKTLSAKKCLDDQTFVCCDKAPCLGQPEYKASTSTACKAATTVPCSSHVTSTEEMQRGKSVCLGYHGKNTKSSVYKLLKVTTTDKATCADIKAEKENCPAGWFLSCCSAENCLDSLPKTTNYVPCKSTTDIACSATEDKVMVKGSSVCFRRFDGQGSGSLTTYTKAENKASCDELKKSLDVTLCPNKDYFVCCDEIPCLGNPEYKATKATKCEEETELRCSSKDTSKKIHRGGQSVCVGYHGVETASNKPLEVFVIDTATATPKNCDGIKDAKKDECALGWYVSCCTTLDCLDKVKKTEFKACESSKKTACSATSYKFMTNTESVCFRTFINTTPGSRPKSTKAESGSCTAFKPPLDIARCPNDNYFVCCTGKFCLDDLRKYGAEHAEKCEEKTTVTCSREDPSKKMKHGESVCVGQYGQISATDHKLLKVTTTKKTVCSDIKAEKEKCPAGWYVACCFGENCLDSLPAATNFEACESKTETACSAESKEVITNSQSVCVGLFSDKSSGKIAKTSTHNMIACDHFKNIPYDVCPNEQFFVCCDSKLCLDEPANKAKEARKECEMVTELRCSTESPSVMMQPGKSVCVGYHGVNTKNNKPLEVFAIKPTTSAGNCGTIINDQKVECPKGWFVSCCTDWDCLDEVVTGKFHACDSPKKTACSTTSKGVIDHTSTDAACFRTFKSNDAGSLPVDTKGKPSSCEDLKASLTVSQCPDEHYFVCCEEKDKACLDLPANKPEKATKCEVATALSCSSKDPSKTMKSGKTVCVGYHGKKTEKDNLPLAVFVRTPTSDCGEIKKNEKANCATGWYVYCCDGLNCLDKVSTSEFEACKSATETACSATSPKVMKKGTSVCIKVYPDKKAGTVGTVSVPTYESCEKAKAHMKAICAGKYYTCCETENCLDKAKAEASEECDSPGGTDGIKCLSSNPSFAATKGKSVCLAIHTLGTSDVEQKIVKEADCEAARDAECSGGSTFYCCDTINCLDDAKNKLVDCPGAAFKTTSNQFLPFGFLFLFYLLI